MVLLDPSVILAKVIFFVKPMWRLPLGVVVLMSQSVR